MDQDFQPIQPCKVLLINSLELMSKLGERLISQVIALQNHILQTTSDFPVTITVPLRGEPQQTMAKWRTGRRD